MSLAFMHVALDVVRSAFKGRAMLMVLLSLAAFFGLLLSALDLEVVEGSLAAYRFFGMTEGDDVAATLGARLSVMVHIGVLAFGIVAGAGAAPTLLAPGRVEAMLALPVSRTALVVGTYLGVLSLTTVAGALIAAGIAGILWWKVGLLPLLPAMGAGSAVLGFAAVYAVMLLAATVIRNTSLGIGLGYTFWMVSALSSGRDVLVASFEDPITARILRTVLAPLPQLSVLAGAGWAWSIQPELWPNVLWSVAGTLVFAVSALVAAVWVVTGKDY